MHHLAVDLAICLPAGEVRTAVASAVRHTFVDAPHPVDALLPSVIGDFLARIGDEDRCSANVHLD